MSTKPKDLAANELVRTMICNRALLLGIATRVLSSRELAEDVVQDAAVRACAMASPERGSPLRLSCCMVRNLAIDRLRRGQLERRHLAPEAEAESATSPLDDPFGSVACRQIVAHVLRALDELPRRTRYAFLQHRLHDVPQKEIAAALGVSTTLVNFMIRDATAHCRAYLASGAVEPLPFRLPAPAGIRDGRPAAKPAPVRLSLKIDRRTAA
ncbi:sigma-70 family RNA polymerase sigma factor [Azorhizobium caulinodans]|uniref:sigma-70 family RNA polymerase sigma factor n=1 Tax=Azorhizobium caulinodans TaxID=7 RepID=UPI002FBD5A62